MRIFLALWFFAHGVAHLPGFIVSWQLRTFTEFPFRTTILADSVDVGTVGVRIIGVGWLLGAVAFMALAVATMLRVPCWQEGDALRPGILPDTVRPGLATLLDRCRIEYRSRRPSGISHAVRLGVAGALIESTDFGTWCRDAA
jgi:hypothetical protein